MIAPKRSPRIALALDRQADRLVMPFTAWPTYVLIPVGIILLLSAFVPLEINERLYSRAKPLQLNGPEMATTTNLWFAISPTDRGVTIRSIDGEIFQLDNDASDSERAEGFRVYLQSLKKSVIASATLANRIDPSTTVVVLSADEQLTYHHVRPVIYALASAGITRYAFEGRIYKE